MINYFYIMRIMTKLVIEDMTIDSKSDLRRLFTSIRDNHHKFIEFRGIVFPKELFEGENVFRELPRIIELTFVNCTFDSITTLFTFSKPPAFNHSFTGFVECEVINHEGGFYPKHMEFTDNTFDWMLINGPRLSMVD